MPSGASWSKKARKALPEAAKQAKEARAQAKALEAESESLSPFRFIRRHQLKKQLPQARERAQAMEKRFLNLKGGAELPIREDLDAQIKHLDKQLEPGEAKLREAQQSVMHLEGLQKAQEAAQAREAMQTQARAKQEALQAQIERTAATVKAGVAKRQAERAAPKVKAKERTQAPRWACSHPLALVVRRGINSPQRGASVPQGLRPAPRALLRRGAARPRPPGLRPLVCPSAHGHPRPRSSNGKGSGHGCDGGGGGQAAGLSMPDA